MACRKNYHGKGGRGGLRFWLGHGLSNRLLYGVNAFVLFQKLLAMSTHSPTPAPSQARHGVIFDLDGTLIDTADDLAAAMNHALALHDIAPVPTRDVRHLIGHGARAMIKGGFEQIAGKVPADAQLDRLVGEFIDYYRTNIAVHSRPFPGVLGFIDLMQNAGVRLAVCTNKREGLARPLLEALALTDRFDVIVGGDTAGVAKPDPAPVHRCLEGMGIDRETAAERVLFVGDSDTDLKAGIASGLPVVLCRFGYGPTLLGSEAALTLEHYDDLGPWVLARFGLGVAD